MIIRRKDRTGFTLIELLVVIAIIAILIGLLIPAVQKVRESGMRASSMNNLHQLAIACHSYNDSYQALPAYYAYPTYNYNQSNGSYSYSGSSGNWAFLLLPYIEQDNQYNGTPQHPNPGPLQYSYVENYSYNGQSYNYSYSYTYPGSGYQASRAAGGLIQAFLVPADPTWSTIPTTVTNSPLSYLANYQVLAYGGSMNLAKITDGTSNTIMLAEGYANASYTYNYTYNSPTFNENINEQIGSVRVWNYDPFVSSFTFSETYSYTYSNGVYNYVFNLTEDEITYGYFEAYGAYNSTTGQYTPFQVMPMPGTAQSYSAQSCTSAGLCVALADASVRVVSPSISLTTFNNACTPTSGDLLGPDW